MGLWAKSKRISRRSSHKSISAAASSRQLRVCRCKMRHQTDAPHAPIRALYSSVRQKPEYGR